MTQEEEISVAAESGLARRARTVLLVGAAIYATLAVMHFTTLPSALRFQMGSVAFATALSCSVMALIAGPLELRRFSARFLQVVISALLLVNSFAHLVLSGDPMQSTNIAVCLVAFGVFLARPRDYGTFVAVALIGWLSLALEFGGPGPWLHYGMFLAEATAVSVFTFALKRLGYSALLAARSCERSATLAATEAAQDAARLAEEAARLANQAIAADRAKSAFLANMSHELRTPLNAVIGFSDCLINFDEAILPMARVREYGDQINQAGGHLLALINEVLDFSKIEAGFATLDQATFDLAEIIAEAEAMMAARATSGGLNLRVDHVQGLWIEADPLRLKQILLNLLSNAIKFTPPGGTVSVSVKRSPGWLAIEVADTGVGIPADQLDLVRMPFHQVDNSHSRIHEGTGLGLAIVDKLIKLHDGVFDLESKVEAGTTAIVRLRSPCSLHLVRAA